MWKYNFKCVVILKVRFRSIGEDKKCGWKEWLIKVYYKYI